MTGFESVRQITGGTSRIMKLIAGQKTLTTRRTEKSIVILLTALHCRLGRVVGDVVTSSASLSVLVIENISRIFSCLTRCNGLVRPSAFWPSVGMYSTAICPSAIAFRLK